MRKYYVFIHADKVNPCTFHDCLSTRPSYRRLFVAPTIQVLDNVCYNWFLKVFIVFLNAGFDIRVSRDRSDDAHPLDSSVHDMTRLSSKYSAHLKISPASSELLDASLTFALAAADENKVFIRVFLFAYDGNKAILVDSGSPKDEPHLILFQSVLQALTRQMTDIHTQTFTPEALRAKTEIGNVPITAVLPHQILRDDLFIDSKSKPRESGERLRAVRQRETIQKNLHR